jgi:hypothetical protein
MAAAAARSCPVTSPITSIVLPSCRGNASYLSPTWARLRSLAVRRGELERDRDETGAGGQGVTCGEYPPGIG